MKTLSIRRRFILWSSGVTGLALLAVALLTTVHSQEEQMELVDSILYSNATLLMRVEAEGETAFRHAIAEAEATNPWFGVLVFNRQGQVQRSSDRIPDMAARVALESRGSQSIDDGEKTWRVLAFSIPAGWLVVCQDLDEFQGMVEDLVATYGVAFPLVAILSGLAAWGVSGLVVAPLGKLTRTAETIGGNALHQRVALSGRDDEIGRLEQVFNDMVARLEESFAQAKRFAADASHELRTPLTILRGQVDQLLHDTHHPPDTERTLLSLQQEIMRLQRICENLLLLTRFDAAQVPLKMETVDGTELVEAACEAGHTLAEERGLGFESDIESGISVTGDADLLSRALLNLVDNAVKFTEPGGRIRVGMISHAAQGIAITVGNTGNPIPPERREKIFDRFYRLETDVAKNGSGLGLSLAREIAQAHGGTLELVEPATAGWVVLRMKLPGVRGTTSAYD